MREKDIVIRLTEEDYLMYKNDEWNIPLALCDALQKGIVLPKGHGDLIDRKELEVVPIDITDLPKDRCLMVYLAEDVDGAKAIIEADKENEHD